MEDISKIISEAKGRNCHTNFKEYDILCSSTMKGGESNFHDFYLCHKQTKKEIPLLSFWGTDEMRNKVFESFKDN